METRYKVQTKKVKKKRLNVARTLVFILFVYMIVCFGIYLYNKPIRHYEITGTNYLEDADILRYLKLTDYPSMFSINSKKMERKLKKNKFIQDAKVTYDFIHFYLKINITENKPILQIKNTNKIVLADGTVFEDVENNYNLAILLNETPDESLSILTTEISKLTSGIETMISEIEYAPSYNKEGDVIDKNRFLLYMSDDNLVYITAKKTKLLNKYLDVIATPSIKGHGTLYLDGDEDRYSFKYFKDVVIKEDKKDDEVVISEGDVVDEE